MKFRWPHYCWRLFDGSRVTFEIVDDWENFARCDLEAVFLDWVILNETRQRFVTVTLIDSRRMFSGSTNEWFLPDRCRLKWHWLILPGCWWKRHGTNLTGCHFELRDIERLIKNSTRIKNSNSALRISPAVTGSCRRLWGWAVKWFSPDVWGVTLNEFTDCWLEGHWKDFLRILGWVTLNDMNLARWWLAIGGTLTNLSDTDVGWRDCKWIFPQWTLKEFFYNDDGVTERILLQWWWCHWKNFSTMMVVSLKVFFYNDGGVTESILL